MLRREGVNLYHSAHVDQTHRVDVTRMEPSNRLRTAPVPLERSEPALPVQPTRSASKTPEVDVSFLNKLPKAFQRQNVCVNDPLLASDVNF